MSIRAFNVGAKKGLRNARAENLPGLVAIAGPNGSGKSALLELLWEQRHSFLEPGSEALYVGPNRAWRGGPLQDIAVRGLTLDYEAVLKQDNLPGFQYAAPGGHQWLSGMARLGSNADDSQAFVKASIARINNRVQTHLQREFQRQGQQIKAGSFPDLLGPLKELVQTLLPHLVFQEVDDTNSNDIRIIFKPAVAASDANGFDIDDLSSGEKAAIALFLPFIERRVKEIVGDEAPTTTDSAQPPLTLLLDEPEIHLHPLLQINVLNYMRDLVKSQSAQFIFTTHSPTMLDALDTNELFMLSPASIAPDNQLSRVTDTLEQLEIARSITGSTHLLTRGKPIVLVEGERDSGPTASDERLIKQLVPQAAHWAVVPSHGKREVITAVKNMRAARLNLPGLPIFGLVDSDAGTTTSNEVAIVKWPVAMVENLLLDPQALAKVLEPYPTVLSKTEEAIRGRLRAIASARVEEEIELRLKAQLPATTLRISPRNSEEANQQIDEQTNDYRRRVADLDLQAVTASTRTDVEAIVTEGKELERFHGKKILRAFYNESGVSSTGLGWNAFLTEIARQASQSERTVALTQSAAKQITFYVPSTLIEGLRQAGLSPEDALFKSASAHLTAWSEGTPLDQTQLQLRDSLFQFARSELCAADRRTEIFDLASAIGVGA